MTLSGFWSYVRDDDAAEGGRIRDLAHDIVDQYRLQTGDTVELFLDRDSLEWGAEWEARINSSLDSVAFFVPVLTPRYFQSAACRSEFQRLILRADEDGVGALVLPILYFDPIGHASADDDLLQLARDHNWVDWTELRFEERTSGQYRRAVSDLATRLVAANRDVEEAAVARSVSASEAGDSREGQPSRSAVVDEDDEDGQLEILVGLEESLPRLAGIAEEMGADITQIGERTAATQAAAEARPGGVQTFAARLNMLRELGEALADPVTSLDSNSREFAKTLNVMDLGVRTVVQLIQDDAAEFADAADFFTAVRGLAASGNEAFGRLESLSASSAGIEKISREARPIIRQMRDALSRVTEGRTVLNAWTTLIDDLEANRA